MGLPTVAFRRPQFRFIALASVLIFSTLFYLSFPTLTSSYHDYFPEGFGPPLPPPHSPWNRPPRRPWGHKHPGGERFDIGVAPPPSLNTNGGLWEERADRVRQAFLHAYRAYEKCATGWDELLPITCRGVDNFNGWGLTVVESLDTMWLMGLYDEFDAALPVVAQMNFTMAPNKYAPFFETVIRYLGGLLSAYALSGEAIFLSRADDLGTLMLPAFDTPSGFPMYSVNTVTGATSWSWNAGAGLWAEAYSCQLEYKYLAYLTGRQGYYDRAENLMQRLYRANTTATDGLYPTMWTTFTGEPLNTLVSVGAFADSGYEYLLKQYLLTGRIDTQVLDTYIKSANLIISHLMFVTPSRGLLYVTDAQGPHQLPSHTMEHLSCFLPGLLALGVHTLGSSLTPAERELHLWAAKGLGQTCYIMYADQVSGLAPDEISMMAWAGPYKSEKDKVEKKMEGLWLTHLAKWQEEDGGAGRQNVGEGGDPPGVRPVEPIRGSEVGEKEREYRVRKAGYLLRPETVESLYLLWRVTGDEVWRERGWEVFEAIERSARLEENGYASVVNVGQVPTTKKNEMPSFFLAETVKYLYLLFTDEELIPLDQWVFNTEAHPFPVFEWSDWEKARYGIRSASASTGN